MASFNSRPLSPRPNAPQRAASTEAATLEVDIGKVAPTLGTLWGAITGRNVKDQISNKIKQATIKAFEEQTNSPEKRSKIATDFLRTQRFRIQYTHVPDVVERAVNNLSMEEKREIARNAASTLLVNSFCAKAGIQGGKTQDNVRALINSYVKECVNFSFSQAHNTFDVTASLNLRRSGMWVIKNGSSEAMKLFDR